VRTVNITVVWNVTSCAMVNIFRSFTEIIFHREYGGSKILRNVGEFKQNRMSQNLISRRIVWFEIRCLIEMLALNFPVRLTGEPGLLGPEKIIKSHPFCFYF
jgi:hypothetical protein